MSKRNTNARTLTAAGIKKLKAGPKRREIADSTSGLYLVVQTTGAKSWALRYRDKTSGKSVKLWLGHADDGEETDDDPTRMKALTLLAARAKANELQRQRKRGIDPVAEKRKRDQEAEDAKLNAFGPLARRHVEAIRDAGQRRWRNRGRLLGLLYPTKGGGEPLVRKGGLADKWALTPVSEINADMVEAVVEGAITDGVPGARPRPKERRTVATARALHGALSAFFRWLRKRRKIAANPCADVERLKAQTRDRTLTDAEIVAVWTGCDQLGPRYAALVRLLLLTGGRLKEIAHMRWDELSPDRTIWTLPKERAKNKHPLIMPLPKAARDIIAAVPRIEGSDYVLTFGGGPMDGFSPAKRRLDAASGVKGWVYHDLRRTLATNLQKLGVRLEVTEGILNHVAGSRAGVVGIYQRHDWHEEKRAALQAWSDRIAALVEGRATAPNVYELAARR